MFASKLFTVKERAHVQIQSTYKLLNVEFFCFFVGHLLALIFLDDLIYRNFEGDIVVAGVTAVLIDPELGRSHRLSVRDLSQVKTKLLVVSSLVRKIFIFLHWERKHHTNNFWFSYCQQTSTQNMSSPPELALQKWGAGG